MGRNRRIGLERTYGYTTEAGYSRFGTESVGSESCGTITVDGTQEDVGDDPGDDDDEDPPDDPDDPGDDDDPDDPGDDDEDPPEDPPEDETPRVPDEVPYLGGKPVDDPQVVGSAAGLGLVGLTLLSD